MTNTGSMAWTGMYGGYWQVWLLLAYMADSGGCGCNWLIWGILAGMADTGWYSGFWQAWSNGRVDQPTRTVWKRN